MRSVKRTFIVAILLSVIFPLALQAEKADNTKNYQSGMHIRRFQDVFKEMSGDEQKEIKTMIEKYASQLDEEIAKIDEYDKKKQNHIDVSMKRLETAQTDAEKYDANYELYRDYICVNYDSLYKYINNCITYAEKLNDREKLVRSQLNLAFLFLNVSYFKEAIELLNSINMDGCSEELQMYNTEVQFRLEFSDGFYFPWYLYPNDQSLNKMTQIYEEKGKMLPDNSELKIMMLIGLNFHKHAYKEGVEYSLKYLTVVDKNSFLYTEGVGNVGFCYMGTGNYEEAMKYMTESAVLSIQRGYKNYSAMRKIAEMMWVIGDVDHAYQYEMMAMKNANSYNSKYRIVESAKGMLPISEGMHEKIDQHRHIMAIAIVVLSVLLVLLILFILKTYRLRAKVSSDEIQLKKQNEELKQQYAKIEENNKALTENHQITSILIGHFISANATRLEMLNKLNKTVSVRMKVRDVEGMMDAVSDFTDDRKTLFPSVDEIITAFFPNFPEQFNSLLREDSRYEVSKDGKLPAEMKIFALWRLGVTKNEDIARCLDYSLYTIKSYKTHVMNATDYDKDEFYDHLMDITLNDI